MCNRITMLLIVAATLPQLGCGGRNQQQIVEEKPASAPNLIVAEVAVRAREVLAAKCFPCHGQNGNERGGFDFALNRDRLLGKLIVAGSPAKSLLFERIESGEMPPDGENPPNSEITISPLTDAERGAIRNWIAAGAPEFEPPKLEQPFISPQELLVTIQADLKRMEPRDRKFARYFTLTHLHNGGYSQEEIENYRRSLSKLVNSLSWGKDVVKPMPVDTHKTILRIDIRNFEWNENDAWSRIIATDPYHVTYDTLAAKYCNSQTQSEMPHVRADWFVFAASRPPLYHEILDIPKSDRKLEEKLRVNVAANLRDAKVARAAFIKSGVSASNRMIERHPSEHGAYWKSYDFATSSGKQNLLSRPLGPGVGKFDFQHDGGEIIFNLPNGLQAYMLVKATGERIDEGPTEIVEDNTARQRGERDSKVVNGISCMSCHNKGMIPKDDEVLSHVVKNRGGFDSPTFDAVVALYPGRDDFRQLLERDARRFSDAVAETGAELSDVEPVASLARQFKQPLTLRLAAAEVGVNVQEFELAVRKSPELVRTIGKVLDGGIIPREQFLESFPKLTAAVKGTDNQSIASSSNPTLLTPSPTQPKAPAPSTIPPKGPSPSALSTRPKPAPAPSVLSSKGAKSSRYDLGKDGKSLLEEVLAAEGDPFLPSSEEKAILVGKIKHEVHEGLRLSPADVQELKLLYEIVNLSPVLEAEDRKQLLDLVREAIKKAARGDAVKKVAFDDLRTAAAEIEAGETGPALERLIELLEFVEKSTELDAQTQEELLIRIDAVIDEGRRSRAFILEVSSITEALVLRGEERGKTVALREIQKKFELLDKDDRIYFLNCLAGKVKGKEFTDLIRRLREECKKTKP